MGILSTTVETVNKSRLPHLASPSHPQDGNDYLYDVVSVFHAVSGGDWAQRPALFDTLWRVKNLEVTYGQWSVLASIRRQVHTSPGYTHKGEI